MLRRVLTPRSLQATRLLGARPQHSQPNRPSPVSRVFAIPTLPHRIATRSFASKSSVDEQIEEIQDQYATAKDEVC